MTQVGSLRYIEFRIADIDGNPVTNRDLAAVTPGQRVLVYLARDTVACSDPVTLTNWGSTGRYYASYTPSAVGHDYLEIYDELYDLRWIDVEDVASQSGGDTVTVNQDYGGVGRFVITDPDPETFTLYWFLSFDWQAGRQNPDYAVNGTAIDSSGNWVTTSLELVPDTYHVVALNDTGIVHVLATFLQVAL